VAEGTGEEAIEASVCGENEGKYKIC